VVILNPRSKNGASLKAFNKLKPDLHKLLGPFEVYQTKAPRDATEQVRSILKQGSFDQILIAGGDGSINEAVNGYFHEGKLLRADVPLGVINLGTGGDFYKTLLRDSSNYQEALSQNRLRMVDCGLTTLEKGLDPQYFINITSIGLGGDVNRQMKASSFQSGMPAYFYHSLTSLLKYSPPNCKFIMKDKEGKTTEIETGLVNFFVCNAEFNGGGMRWAPESDIEDGVFDLVLVSNVPKHKLITESHKIYSGKIREMTGVQEFHASEVIALPERTVSQEIDGETRDMDHLRTHEFHFKIVPRSLPLVL
ncbi:MAG TPA: diacylglycerol kinase family protein, partial [Leptospiraceae bacterium]|nr:diacylglycerol kinase family protein [Leptospiraceae bacterium]